MKHITSLVMEVAIRKVLKIYVLFICKRFKCMWNMHKMHKKYVYEKMKRIYLCKFFWKFFAMTLQKPMQFNANLCQNMIYTTYYEKYSINMRGNEKRWILWK